MSELKLKKLTLRNWAKFKTAHVDFPDHGLIVVTGINRASGGSLQSVGSGKTSLGEAISHTLLGVSSHFDSIGDYSRDEAGDTYVRLETVYKTKPLVVEMGYKCKELNRSGPGLRYSYGKSDPISRGKVDQTRADLLQLLGVTELLTSWTLFLDGDNLQFNRLAQAQAVELVMTALRQPPWSVYHASSKKLLDKMKTVASEDSGALEAARQTLEDTEQKIITARERLKLEKEAFESKKQKADITVKNCQEEIDSLQLSTKRVQLKRADIAKQIDKTVLDSAEENKAIEVERNALNDRLALLREKHKKLSKNADAAQQQVKDTETVLRNYSGKNEVCPTCQQRIKNVNIDPRRIAELETAIEEQSAASDLANKACLEVESKIQSVQEALEINRTKNNALGAEKRVSELSVEDRKLERIITENQKRIHVVETSINVALSSVSDSAVTRASAILEERLAQKSQLETKIAELASSLTDTRSLLTDIEYWNVAFSPYGIPNMVLREAIGPLNAEAQRLSAILTGGTLEVVFKTQRELAAGTEKAQLIVEVNNRLGSKKLRGNSKGEAGLVNYIISESLCSVGQVTRNIGFQWLDEVLPNQDQKVCRSVYAYLKQKASQQGITIFLVDHNPEAVSYADKVISVEKRGDNSACESVILG